jgi:hypothetical protein
MVDSFQRVRALGVLSRKSITRILVLARGKRRIKRRIKRGENDKRTKSVKVGYSGLYWVFVLELDEIGKQNRFAFQCRLTWICGFIEDMEKSEKRALFWFFESSELARF